MEETTVSMDTVERLTAPPSAASPFLLAILQIKGGMPFKGGAVNHFPGDFQRIPGFSLQILHRNPDIRAPGSMIKRSRYFLTGVVFSK